METAEEKLAWLASAHASRLAFEEVRPDAKANWLNLTSNDFDDLIAVASKDVKASKKRGDERAIFKLYGQGVFTGRDEWLYSATPPEALQKADAFLSEFGRWAAQRQFGGSVIKWSRNLKRRLEQGKTESSSAGLIQLAAYRPFTALN